MDAIAGPAGSHVRVFLVDDNLAFLDSASHLVARESGIAVVGRARSAEEAIPRVAQLQPDVVLVDLAMPGIGGLEGTRRMKAGPAAPRVIIVSLHDTPEYRLAARIAGADAFVAKRDLAAVLMPVLAEMFRSMVTARDAPPGSDAGR